MTQEQKFHTADVNQCLHNKSGNHGFSNVNLFNFTFLLVDFGKVLCCSSETQMLLLEKTIFHKYRLFCERFIAFTFDFCGFLLGCLCGPVINSAFGRRCQKVVSRGREDMRVWYRETMFS